MFRENLKAGDTGHASEHNHINHRLNQALSVEQTDAQHNGITDDTAALQSALDTLTAQIYFPSGVYAINALTGLRPHSNQTLLLHPGAVLQAIPNAADSYALILLNGVSRVQILGGIIQGERGQHRGSTGEWGMGINMTACTSIVVQDVTVQDCWGDGLYIAGASQDIHLERVISNHHRRQGMSIVQVDNFTARDCQFINTTGTAPQAGVDLEPNTNADLIRHVLFDHCRFLGNAAYGLVLNGAARTIEDVSVMHGRMSGNQWGIYADRGVNGLLLMGNDCTGNSVQNLLLNPVLQNVNQFGNLS